MSPRHLLLTLCLAVVTLNHAKSDTRIANHSTAPDFWWDLTLDHSATISTVLSHPTASEHTLSPDTGLLYTWDLGWAKGVTSMWDAGQLATWTAWTWQSKSDSEITGGGFVFNRTGEEMVFAGVSWLRDGHSDTITWNCFVDGNLTARVPWDSWELHFDENGNTTIGFVRTETSWGFYLDSDQVLSKHCADGIPVAGKRFKFLHGKEVEKSVHDDPFQRSSFSRHKRSPDFFDKVGQKLKEWVDKAKKLLGIGQQADGQGDQNGEEGREGTQRCNTFLDLLVKIIDMIFRRRGTSVCPPGATPAPRGAGGAPPQDEAGGDPPGGASVPPADAEELDPSQNDAIRDWE